MFAPSRPGDQRFRRWLARFQRTIASPRTVQAFLRINFEMDARPILPLIQAPTLILHRRDFQFLPIAHGRYLAEHIPGATLVEHGKANAGPGSNASLSRFCTRTSFPRIGTCHLRERPTVHRRA
jgi:pimeloyl-ACP methyl ester carboxylesterase